MDSVNVGILGYGARGKDFANLFSRPKDDVHVTAIADPIFALSEWDASLSAFQPYNCVEDLLKDKFVNVVVIATPDFLHEEHACMALNAGKHVFLEKPMAITPQGCDRIVETAKRNNRIVYVGHNLRHFTVIKKMKEIIDSGAVGEVKIIWCRQPVSYGRWAYFDKSRWHRKKENIGSLFIHKGSHDIDVIQWFAGSRIVRTVGMGKLAVWRNQEGAENEDVLAALFEMENGVQATYSQCHFAYLWCREYMVFGTKGTILNEGDLPPNAIVKLFNKRRMSLEQEPDQLWRFDKEDDSAHGDADKRIAAEFIDVLRARVKPSISIEEAAWAVKAGYATTESMRSGNIPIDIS
jgi:predicted dehydrogenase